MRHLVRAAALAGVLGSGAAAHAQTITVPSFVVFTGASATVTISGVAGRQFALLGSATNTGFSYAGVNLAVGTDVQILTIGALDGAGHAVVPVTPPFPARDRFYIQAVFTTDGFTSIAASNPLVLINYQAASLLMPIGGVISSTGNLISGTAGVTVTRTGVGTYTINHPGLFPVTTVTASITPIIANAYVVSLAATQNVTTVQFSSDTTFVFNIQPIRP